MNKKFEKLKKEGLIDAFNLREDDVFEASFNLLGFFATLHKIDQRLKREGKQSND